MVRELSTKKNQHLVWKKDQSSWVFFLLDGLVRASFSFIDENPRIIGYFVPGALFAQSGSFVNVHDGTISYTAETTATVLRLPQNLFLDHLKNDNQMMHEYLRMTLRNQLLLVDRIVYQGEKGLRAKTVRWLLFMTKYYGKTVANSCEIFVPLTQETIANFLHTTRESVNVILRELETQGYIKLSTKHVAIHDLAGLKVLSID